MNNPWIFDLAEGDRALTQDEIDKVSGGCSPSQWPPCEDDAIWTTGATCTLNGCSRDSGPDY
jgi:hypothetical protein